ncbi:FkbM family methyltransferase [Clostridium cylindrosporum]|uniref:Methyltransferase FkbM family n=1 Tax=Clostridium cylindrosporum DSM 605 TaxID=1121307 RepID=A0A0J8G4N5_CLOCY|nr:FkbM family methyltransferase [Clostridium cylindrosporum]KMT22636.1 methyltransferase FkbM family [Clostridium cylindrosporum DSM 605]
MNSNYINEISNLLNNVQNEMKLEKLLKYIMNSHVYVYGAGNAGEMTYTLLKKANIDIEGFIDKRSEKLIKYMNKPVCKIEEMNNKIIEKENILIIIAFICSYDELKTLKDDLGKYGYKKIFYYHDIYNLVITKEFMSLDLKDDKNIKSFNNEKEDVTKVASFFYDDESRKVYFNFLNAITNCNPDLFSKPTEEEQYFVRDIPFAKGYSRFIDCGAFDGDTAMSLKANKGIIEKIALFEPDNNNFHKLRINLNKSRVAKEEILFPCGVWKTTEILQFESGNQTTSSISDNGGSFIQCIALDEVLRDFKPTFIKMDIEGAEYEALLGAENMIKQYTPDLAISVYHRVEHMWNIPLLIRQFNSNYKFYLRSHAIHGMETILYAVCEERKQMY